MNSHPPSVVTICNLLMFSCTVVESSYRVVAYNVFIERGNVAVVSHYLCIYISTRNISTYLIIYT